MSVGRTFSSAADGTCAACGNKIKVGDEVRRWDDALCHAKCVEAELDLEPDDIVVFRGEGNRPVAVPHDVAIESERPLRAYELHQGGLSWERVALQENYPSANAARMDVKRYLDEAGSLIRDFTRRELLELQLAKLGALQRACWKQAMDGNLPAIGQAHSLIITQNKLMRLESDIKEDEPGKGGGTVIVPGDDEGYSKTLEKIGDRKG